MARAVSVLLLLLLSVGVSAQQFTPDPDWRFENFNSQNHFTSLEVSTMAIDRHGYVWASSGGLQRFDGYHTTVFNSFDRRPGSLKSNYTGVINDLYGRVWVSSLGLCYYDDASGKFVYVYADAKHNFGYVDGFFIQKDYLWFVCEYGLAKLNLHTLKITFTSLKSIVDPLGTYQLNDSTLFVSSREKVYLYNFKSDTYTSGRLIYNHALVKVFAVAKNDKDIFIGTNYGLFVYKSLNHIDLLPGGPKAVYTNDMVFMPQDKQQKYLFIATEGKGLMVYNTLSGKIEYTYEHDAANPNSIPNNIISKLAIDREQRLWLATDLGIGMLDISNQQLKMRFIARNNADELGISKIGQDRYDSSKVWMSSYSQGMLRVDWTGKKTERIYRINNETQSVYDFVQVSRNKFLVASQKEIFEWSPQAGVMLRKALPVPDSLRMVCGIHSLVMAGPSTCFITTNRGLFKYDLPLHRITVASQNTTSRQPLDVFKYILLNGFFDGRMLWAASRNGLFSYDTTNGKTAIYTGSDKNDYFFSDIAPADNGRIVCTSGSGIAIFNTADKTFKVVHTLAGLYKPGTGGAICVKDKLWIASEIGIIYYDLKTGQSSRAEHQASYMPVFARSPLRLIGNEVVFGFRNGYAYFTSDLNNGLMPSDPVIEEVKVNNRAGLLSAQAKASSYKPVFTHLQNSINIAFTSFLFADPDHINFRYRLAGADEQWQYTDGQRSANYVQLPPGDYAFYVQSGNKNGSWNNHLASFSFVIRPPYWQTWWFRGAILLVVVAALYSLYWFKIQHIKAIENIRESIASDFHDDLGSTLSSISIFSEVAVQKAETDLLTTKNMVGDIGTRARSMMHSMNDMVWTIKPGNDNLLRLMRRMEEFSYPVAEAKDIRISFVMDSSLYHIKTGMVIRKNLFLVFKEAFNNAIKYSGADTIEVFFAMKYKKQLMMQISDNGQGFDPDTCVRGNGLNNMQKRAVEINGKLKITTAPGQGTGINIICKIA